MFKRILVPLDGSRFGSHAIRYAQEIAKQFSAEVVMIQVIKPAVPAITAGGAEPGIQSPAAAKIAVQISLDDDKRNISAARRYLSKKVRDLKAKNIESSYKVIVGNPADTIMTFASKNRIDLIIMATSGKSGLKRAVLGSVADEVVRKSGKPVLVTRPKSN